MNFFYMRMSHFHNPPLSPVTKCHAWHKLNDHKTVPQPWSSNWICSVGGGLPPQDTRAQPKFDNFWIRPCGPPSTVKSWVRLCRSPPAQTTHTTRMCGVTESTVLKIDAPSVTQRFYLHLQWSSRLSSAFPVQ